MCFEIIEWFIVGRLVRGSGMWLDDDGMLCMFVEIMRVKSRCMRLVMEVIRLS